MALDGRMLGSVCALSKALKDFARVPSRPRQYHLSGFARWAMGLLHFRATRERNLACSFFD